MFTGIIQDIGKIVKITKNDNSLQLTINLSSYTGRPVKLGDSIAINGVCLTITSISGPKNRHVTFDAVPETVKRTTLGTLRLNDSINIELAIRAGEPLGGHFVQGHIDTVGTISSIKKQGSKYLIQIKPSRTDGQSGWCSPKIIESIIEKGSIAIDGVSLTVVNVESNHFSVALIPFTLTHTILGKKKVGDVVNIELDIIGKWVMKLVSPLRHQICSDEGF
ncbi:MAG: riboflavin synthase [Planctomycetota bacterium]